MAKLMLAEEERVTRACWIRQAKSSQAPALRCKIVLSCAGGASNKEVAQELTVCPMTVGK